MKYSASLILSVLLLCSCSHYYYVSNAQNIPLLKEKDELHISGFVGGWDESECIEVQTSYAVSNKIGIMANFIKAWGGNLSENNNGKGSYFEAAGGYFKPIKENFVFETYGGLGYSGQSHEYSVFHYNPSTGMSSQSGGNSHLSFVRFFIQPSFGLYYKNIEPAVSTRICRVSYSGIEITGGSESITEELDAIWDKSHYFLEPSFTLRAGWKNVKAQVQIASVRYLNNPKLYFHEEAHLSGGLFFTIPVKTK